MNNKIETNPEVRLTRYFPSCGLRASDKPESREVSGYAIVFDSPSAALYEDDEEVVREIISPSAVSSELLASSDIILNFNHDNSRILGRSRSGKGSLSYEVDAHGVRFRCNMPHTPDGDTMLELVRRGDIAGCSFCFTTDYRDKKCVAPEKGREGEKELTTYRVNRITGLYDFSLVVTPAYPATACEARMVNPKEMEQDAHKGKIQAAEMRDFLMQQTNKKY